MAKLEEITTFNIGADTYAVADLNDEAKELLRLHLALEEDVMANKMALLKSQHALASVSNMFLDALKKIQPLDVKAIAERQASEALATARTGMAGEIASQRVRDAANGPKPKARKKPAAPQA